MPDAPPCWNTDYRMRPPAPGLRSELIEAAWNHGYRLERGEADGWLYFASDIDVPGEIGLAVTVGGNGWFLAVEHAGVSTELAAPRAEPVPIGKRAAFGFFDQTALREALHRVYDLSRSLPTAPFYEFQAETEGLGATEADAVARRRIGQDVFRRALLRYWRGRCPLTGIGDSALLRASHIVAWADCASDVERLDVHNGLLLAAHWDAAFDAGLVSFADNGTPLVKPGLSPAAAALFDPRSVPALDLTPDHQSRLARHRSQFGFAATKA
ncbi:MAG TPA: HNH endonuclease [Allosphingosinicella sp.]|jgi:hypothetical protein